MKNARIAPKRVDAPNFAGRSFIKRKLVVQRTRCAPESRSGVDVASGPLTHFTHSACITWSLVSST